MTSPRAPSPRSQTVHYRPGRTPPEGGFEAAGLLAFDPGDGGPARVWSAPEPEREVPNIRAHAEDGRLRVLADGDVDESSSESGLWVALEGWADDLARHAGVSGVASLAPGWCTWYHYFTQVREEDVLENLAAMKRLDLDVGVVQIDDGYQSEIGDWLERSPRFAHPLRELTSRIRAEGRRAGIWVAPLLVGARSKLAAQHAGWLVDGADAGHNWGQPLGALDVTHPDAAGHLQHVFRSLAGWGFGFFKVDFMYAGALEGRRNADTTGIAAYREAVRLIREAIGPGATLLGCGAPILPSVGLYDAMRVSPDVGPVYEPKDGDLGSPSQRSAVQTGRARAFQHGRFWVNDPDCLIVRPEIERRADWAEHVERFGALRMSSDRLEALDRWGLETTRRILRPSPAEPFDLSSLPFAG
ncbi:glycoside hydrolase family 36 protein [Candidatus Nephthysia bennettiae]|uniref:glycoside hydrolase family 36 protein n=1 Tax=Candidatus Nephthysia bennettiae TaxID=3127016 RepID=UPI0030C7637C